MENAFCVKILRKIGMLAVMVSLIMVVAAGCGNVSSETVDTTKPEVLRIGLIPSEDIEEMIKAFEPVRQYLEKELGMSVDVFKATDYTGVIEAMRAEKIEVAYFGPFSYVLAAKRANAQAIVAGGDAEGKLRTYHSSLVTHKDSGLKSIDDVKARAGELTISFVDPASTSGHLIPRGYLQSVGINVDEDFKEVIFAGGHDASILAVKARNVDLGAAAAHIYHRSVEKGLIEEKDVFLIWKSDPIPRSPIAVRGGLDEALIKKIQQAFLDMPQKAPEAFEQFEGRWEGNESYVAVSDETYEGIRQLAIALGKL